MVNELYDLIKSKEEYLNQKGITIDSLEKGDLGHIEISSLTDLINHKYLCRIECHKCHRLYIQILDIETEKNKFFVDEYYFNMEMFEEYIMNIIDLMIEK